MSNQFSFDVFLSHSSKDKEVVRAVAKRLQADGLRVWFDESEIQAGDNIPAKIEEGLERSRVLLLCMSANAFGSDWAQLESGTFRFRDPLNKDRRFIPLRLDRAPIKGSLSQFLYIDWLPEHRERGYAKLLEACRPGQRTAEAPGTRKRVAGHAIQLEFREAIFAYAFARNKRHALTGGNDNAVRLWNLRTRRCVKVLAGHTGAVTDVLWSADRRRALSASSDRTVRLWDMTTGRCIRVLEGHPSEVHTVAWSADGRRALSASLDQTVRLWDVEAGRCLRVLEGHNDFVLSVAWSPDENYALSGSLDRTIRLWDLRTGRCVRVIEVIPVTSCTCCGVLISATRSPVPGTTRFAFGMLK